MDTIDKLLGAAAGFFGQQQKDKAANEIARLQLQTADAAARLANANATANQAVAQQLIPGVSNTTLALGVGTLLAVGILAFALRNK